MTKAVSLSIHRDAGSSRLSGPAEEKKISFETWFHLLSNDLGQTSCQVNSRSTILPTTGSPKKRIDRAVQACVTETLPRCISPRRRLVSIGIHLVLALA